jgi:hypothetical protein
MSRPNKPSPKALADALTDHVFGGPRGAPLPRARLDDENWLMNWGGGQGEERPGRELDFDDREYERRRRGAR